MSEHHYTRRGRAAGSIRRHYRSQLPPDRPRPAARFLMGQCGCDCVKSTLKYPAEVSNWQTIRLYSPSSPTSVTSYTPSRGPVLDVGWGADSSKAYSACLDKTLVEWVWKNRPAYGWNG